MKAKKFKGTPVPSLVGRGPSDTMARREVVALVAARVPRARYDDEKTVRNGISTNVYDAVKAGTLREVKPGGFRLGDVGVWARAKWPKGQFSDVPIFPNRGGRFAHAPGASRGGTGYTHAATLQAAIGEILVLRAENRALAQARAVAEGRVRELEPDAHNWRNWVEKKEGKRRD